jgi:hypothetical protein
MDISAIASIAPAASTLTPGTKPEALAQEFGAIFFRTLLQKTATSPKASGSSTVSWDFFTDHVARNLAQQHVKLFAQMLFTPGSQA